MKRFSELPRLVQLSVLLLAANFLVGIGTFLLFPNTLSSLSIGLIAIILIPLVINFAILTGLFFSYRWALVATQVFWLLQSVGVDTESWGFNAQTGINFSFNFAIGTATGKLVFLFNLFSRMSKFVQILVVLKTFTRIYFCNLRNFAPITHSFKNDIC